MIKICILIESLFISNWFDKKVDIKPRNIWIPKMPRVYLISNGDFNPIKYRAQNEPILFLYFKYKAVSDILNIVDEYPLL
jgi:hypothetical protein